MDMAPQSSSLERLARQHAAMSKLVAVVQELSHARDLNAVMAIVRRSARELTNAEGATFVLKEGEHCFYADEDAISPLWKGQRFPLGRCMSGWVIEHARPAAVEDVFSDPRVPARAYQGTFVKSLAMAPIRTTDPLGAIGVYWASRHRCSADELMLLEALANTTAVAIENVRVYAELERRVRQRTRELESANQELEAFSYAVSHDLRAPLRALSGELAFMREDFGDLNEQLRSRIVSASGHVARMHALIDDMLRLSGVTRRELKLQTFDLGELAADVFARIRASQPGRAVDARIERGLFVEADPGLMQVALENLLSNAWKFTSRRSCASIRFEVVNADGQRSFQVRDNGAGFDPKYADKVFEPFRRLHSPKDFPGTGVGLATVRRIIDRHGGCAWARSDGEGTGATFSFTLGTCAARHAEDRQDLSESDEHYDAVDEFETINASRDIDNPQRSLL